MTISAPPANTAIRERFTIRGEVGAPSFPGWIDRHARRLGLTAELGATAPGRIELTVGGPPDLVDAMELGCSLGPIEVMVDSIDRESLMPHP